MKRISIIFALAALLLAASTASAGAVLFAGNLDGDKFVPDKNVKGRFYFVRYCTVNSALDGQTARTRVEETIAPAGIGGPFHAVVLLPLPPGVDAGSLRIWTSTDKDKDQPMDAGKFRFLDADAAQKLYETVARGSNQVTVVALSGKAAVVIPSFELAGSTKLTVEFTHQAQETRGLFSLELPTSKPKWASSPVERFSLTVTATSDKPLRAVFSPSHAVTVERKGPKDAVIRAKAQNLGTDEDFRLCYVRDQDDLGLRVLAYRAPDENEGYFMLVGNPSGSLREQILPKDLIFVLDTSGSMRGEKIEQARASIDYCLKRLNPGDCFNIVTFGSQVRPFREVPVEGTKENLAAAREFIESAQANGLTNIAEALRQGLSGAAADGRPRIMIFLTDGAPTVGELVSDNIIDTVKKSNSSGTRIFVMGVGYDVNTHLLDRLAQATDGRSEYVTPEEEIDVKVAGLYDRLSQPVLTDVTVSMGGITTNSVYPAKLPALFKGSEVMVFGRYRDGGSASVSVSGTLAGKKITYSCQAEFPKEASGSSWEFVAPLWASRKIGFLLQEIRLHSDNPKGNKELVDEVVRLSKRFGIVTEYTEFLAYAKEDYDHDTSVKLAESAAKKANGQQTGQWATNQSFNDTELQRRMVSSNGGNFYRDRQGKDVFNNRIQQVGQRAFYLRQGQWMDGEDAGKRKTRTVKLFSEEYLRLLRTNRQFAQAQSLGWAVSMNIGEERIVVEKDGKTQAEELKEKDTPPPDQNQRDNNLNGQNQNQQIHPNQINRKGGLNEFNIQDLQNNEVRK